MKNIILAVFVLFVGCGELVRGGNLPHDTILPENTSKIVEGSLGDADSLAEAKPVEPHSNIDKNTTIQKIDTSATLPENVDESSSEKSEYLKLLIGGIVLLTGILLGYFIALLTERKEKKRLLEEVRTQAIRITELEKPFEDKILLTEDVKIKDIPTVEPQKPMPPNYQKFVDKIENALIKIEKSIELASKESQVTRNIQRSLIGLSTNFPGIKAVSEGWKEALQSKQLSLERIHKDLNGGEIRKGLASLYALSFYPKLGNIHTYYDEVRINHNLFVEAINELFVTLKEEAKVNFSLPTSGEPFDEKKYDLIDKNIGPIYDLDLPELIQSLDQTLTPQNQRPIIDVGELGLPDPPTDTGVRFDYPRKTTIGYYSK